MTNVPQKIRDGWADIYRWFDANYNMDGSDEAWDAFWKTGLEIREKYKDEFPVDGILKTVGEMVGEIVMKRRNQAEKILSWDKDEPYPHPKGEIKGEQYYAD